MPVIAPEILTLIAGVISGGVFLVPRALLFLGCAPLLLLHRGMGPWRGLQGTVLGVALVGGVSLWGGAWSGTVSDSIAAYLLIAGIPAALLSWGLDRRGGPIPALGWAFAGWLAVAAGVFGASVVERGTSASSVAQAAVERVVDGVLAASAERAGEDPSAMEGLEAVTQARGRLVRWAVRLFPGLLGVAGLLGLWMNLVYLRWFTGGAREKEDDLCRFELPFETVWFVLACMGVLLLQAIPGAAALPAVWWTVTVGANVLLCLAALFWLQGVAVVNWWFLRLPLSPVLRALGLGMQVMAMAIPVFSTGYLVAGLSDAWLDLRGRSGADSE